MGSIRLLSKRNVSPFNNLRIENKSDLQQQGNAPEGWKRQNFFIWIGGQNRIKETHKNLQLKGFPTI